MDAFFNLKIGEREYYKEVWNLTKRQIENSIFKGKEQKFFKTLYKATLSYMNHGITEASIKRNMFGETITMDAYCLARLFRKFKVKDADIGKICKEDMPYCIVYAGNSHIDIYRYFLNDYFKIEKRPKVFDNYEHKRIVLDPPFELIKN